MGSLVRATVALLLIAGCTSTVDGDEGGGEASEGSGGGTGGSDAGGAPRRAGWIEVEADPAGIRPDGGPRTYLRATFGPPPDVACATLFSDDACVTTSCSSFTFPPYGRGESAGTLRLVSGERSSVAGESEPGVYFLAEPEALWEPGAIVTVDADGDVVAPFIVGLETLPPVELRGWTDQQVVARDREHVIEHDPTTGAVALHVVASDVGDAPQFRVVCRVDGAAGELRVPAAALAPIELMDDESGGVMWVASRAEATVVAGDHLVAIGAETLSGWASVSFE